MKLKNTLLLVLLGISIQSSFANTNDLNELQVLAKQGDALAQFKLGVHYVDGQGVAKDDVQGVYWYRKAAVQGNADAQHSLGLMYYIGHGVEQDTDLALYWYRKAAAQGHEQAQSDLEFLPENNESETD